MTQNLSQMRNQDEYQTWIDAYLKEKDNHVLGSCIEATKLMKENFPELEIVRGHVHCDWGKRGHAWLQAPNGTIIDPTASQFLTIFQYEAWKPGDEVRTGTCMNCGCGIWVKVETLDTEPPHPSACSDECYSELNSYYNSL